MPVNPTQNAAFERALAALRAGEINDAERFFKEVLHAHPRHAAALNVLAIVLTQLGRFVEAEAYLRRALEEQPHSDATLYNYGIVLKALNRPAEALERFTQALSVNSAAAETWSNRGTVFNDLKRYAEAIADFEKAIGLNRRFAPAFCNKGKSLASLKRFDEALAALQEALALKPDMAEAWCGCGYVHWGRRRYDEALGAFDKALALSPNLVEAWLGRANALAKHAHYDDALAAYDKVLILKPDFAEAWLGRGNIWLELKRHEEALVAYDKALALRADLADAWLGRGNAFADLQQYDSACAACDKALKLNHDLDFAASLRLHAKLHRCDWTHVEAEIAELMLSMRERRVAEHPFAILSIPSSPADQLQCAKCYMEAQAKFAPIWSSEIYVHDRIRVAYVSSDFREHPVGYLTAGLFEHHDKSRFEVTAISLGGGRDSHLRRRMESSFERFLDCRSRSDLEIAEIIRRLEIDIAVDLMGHTQHARPGIFARRPAPIQVSYLGYLGTMGAEFIDYLIADEIAVPFAQQPYYLERIVHLPGSFVVNDDRLAIAPHRPSRDEVGLPAEGFVFCSFNSSYKLNRPMFELWMRLLARVQGSVLWLLQSNAEMAINLRREAQRCGIDSQRIVFAGRVSLSEHLARQQLADLFLDTIPYNAGATAAAALWAGIPVLTMLGNTFVGRMAASMLHAVGLPELATDSQTHYEAMALRIAAEPALCASLKEKLARTRGIFPLFDTAGFTRNIEAAYTTMWRLYQQGEPPRQFAVSPNG